LIVESQGQDVVTVVSCQDLIKTNKLREESSLLLDQDHYL